MVTFSLITKDGGILTKSYRLRKGKLQKDSSQCFVDKGKIETVTMEFNELPDFLDSLQDNQALIHGCSLDAPAPVVAKRLLPANPGAITRTLDNFFWPEEGIIMFDYDVPDGKEALSKRELIQAIRSLHPELATAAMVWRASASSNIFGEDGKPHKGLENQRIYIPYINPDNMQEFVANLHRIAWDKGYGYLFISVSGRVHPRCLFDNAVFSPERLDFAAGAVCGKGLVPQVPHTEYIDGDVVDLDNIGDVYNTDRYMLQVEAAKASQSKDIEEVKKAYEEVQAEKLVNERGVSKLKAKKIIASRLDLKLQPDDIVYTNEMEPLVITEMLQNPEKYDGMVVRDPLEPEYGVSKAKIFIDGDDLTINSFAHGGQVFKLQWSKQLLLDLLDKSDQNSEVFESVIDKLTRSTDLTPIDEEQLLATVAKKAKVSKGVIKKQVTDKRKRLEKEGEFNTPLEDLSHNEISERFLSILPETAVSTEGKMYKYNCRSWITIAENDLLKDLTKHFDGLPKCSRVADYNAIIKLTKEYRHNSTFFCDTPPVIAMHDTCWQLDTKEAKVRDVTHKKEYRVRFVLPFDTVPANTPMPMFDGFCEWAFESEPVQKDLMQEIFGAILFGVLNRDWHRAVLFQGKGGNGKGVMLDILKNLVPKQYVTSVSPDKFNNPVMLALLSGKLLNAVPELPRRQRFPSSNFKEVVDSSDLLGKELYKTPFTFPSTAGHLFSSNYRLNTSDLSDGMRRRWLFVNFANKVTAGQKIPEFGKIIAEKEGPQIMNWARKGVERLYKKSRFTETESAKRLEEAMFDASDYEKQFITDEDIFDYPNGDKVSKTTVFKIKRARMYTLYREWCDEQSIDKREIKKKKEFNISIEGTKSGVYLDRYQGEYYWYGVKLKGGRV